MASPLNFGGIMGGTCRKKALTEKCTDDLVKVIRSTQWYVTGGNNGLYFADHKPPPNCFLNFTAFP